MSDYRYPAPTVSPYDDFAPYIPVLITAVSEYLLNPGIWVESEQDQALGYMQELLAFLMQLEDFMNKSVVPTEIIIAYGMVAPVLLKKMVVGEVADEVLVTVDSAFDTGLLSVGDEGQHDRLMLTGDNVLADEFGQYQTSPQLKYAEETDLYIYLTGAPTTGVCRVTLYSYRT